MDLDQAMERLVRVGPVEAMCEDERAAGFAPVKPGAVGWFSSDDWPDDVVVSVRGRDVRIVAIKARRPGSGAFSRLITSIARDGLTPMVVEPMPNMTAILQRWNWMNHVVGEGFERQEIWWPRVKWLLDRAAKSEAHGTVPCAVEAQKPI